MSQTREKRRQALPDDITQLYANHMAVMYLLAEENTDTPWVKYDLYCSLHVHNKVEAITAVYKLLNFRLIQSCILIFIGQGWWSYQKI